MASRTRKTKPTASSPKTLADATQQTVGFFKECIESGKYGYDRSQWHSGEHIVKGTTLISFAGAYMAKQLKTPYGVTVRHLDYDDATQNILLALDSVERGYLRDACRFFYDTWGSDEGGLNPKVLVVPTRITVFPFDKDDPKGFIGSMTEAASLLKKAKL